MLSVVQYYNNQKIIKCQYDFSLQSPISNFAIKNKTKTHTNIWAKANRVEKFSLDNVKIYKKQNFQQ